MQQHLAVYTSVANKNASVQRVKTSMKTPLIYFANKSYSDPSQPAWLNGKELARQTSEPGSNPSWDTTVHPVCETFNVMHVVKCVHLGTIALNVW